MAWELWRAMVTRARVRIRDAVDPESTLNRPLLQRARIRPIVSRILYKGGPGLQLKGKES